MINKTNINQSVNFLIRLKKDEDMFPVTRPNISIYPGDIFLYWHLRNKKL